MPFRIPSIRVGNEKNMKKARNITIAETMALPVWRVFMKT